MKARAILSLLALLMATYCAYAATFQAAKMTKQVGGGSTGDSLTAGPDTSNPVFLSSRAVEWYVYAMGDSQMIYTTQVSADSANWFIIDIDTCPAGMVEYTGTFPTLPADTTYIRVILDPIPGAAPYGASFIAARF